MIKPDFEKAKRCAIDLRLRQPAELRLNPFKLCVDSNIIIDSIQNYAEITGIPVWNLMPRPIEGSLKIWDSKSGRHLILYDRNQNRAHLAWGIGHELGHAYLNHTDDNRNHEIEAHCFSAEFYAPEIALRYIMKKLNCVTEADIHYLFGLSDNAAEKRHSYLYKTIPYQVTAAERKLLENLRPQLDHYITNKRRFFSNYPGYFDLFSHYAGLSKTEVIARLGKRF